MIMYHDHDPVPDHIINQIFFENHAKKRKKTRHVTNTIMNLYIQKQIWLMLMHAAAPAPVAITDVRV